MVRDAFARPYRATTLAAISLMSLIAFESMAVTTAMPTAARALDGISLYAAAFGATLATAVVGIVTAGEWCDRRGPAQPMGTGVSLMLIGLVVAGTAPEMEILILGRVLQGAGFGLTQVSIYVLIGRRYPSAMHATMFAALSTSWAVPSVIGPPIAGLIADHLGWRWVFLAVPALGLPAAAVVMSQVRHIGRPEGASDNPVNPRTRIFWAVIAALGAGLLHTGGQLTGITSLALILAGLALIAVAATRLLPAGTTRFARGLPTVVALRGLAAAAFFTAEVFIPLILIREHGLSPAIAGLALTAGTLGWVAGTWLPGRVSGSAAPGPRLRIGLATLTTGILVSGIAIWPDAPSLIAVAGWTVAGAGMGLTFPTLAVQVLRLSPVEKQGTNSAAMQLSDSLGTATAFAISGAVFAALIATEELLAYTLVLGASVLIALLATSGSGRAEAPEASG